MDGPLCPHPRTSTEQMGWSRWPLETPSWATPDTLCQSCLHDPRFVHVATLPAPFARPGHPALCLEDPLALKVTPQPDSWCGSEGPAPPGKTLGGMKHQNRVLPSFLPPPLTKHLLCQALGILWGPCRHGLCLMGEMVFNQIVQIIT